MPARVLNAAIESALNPEHPGDEAHARPSSARARDGILHGLYNGRFVPGQKLIEADLVRVLGVPRSYVREALARLEAEGLVEIIPFRGAYVRSFEPEEAHNIDLTFAALMALAARQAAERISEHDALRLTAALEKLKTYSAERDLFDYAMARERFYRLIIAISGNREIERICPITQGHIMRIKAWRSLGEAAHRGRLTHYQAVLDAIVARDAKAAERAVWTSIENLASTEGWAPAKSKKHSKSKTQKRLHFR